MKRPTRRHWLRWLAASGLGSGTSGGLGATTPSATAPGAASANPASAGLAWPGEAWSWPPVRPNQTLRFPRDFGSHPDFRTEWWYLTAWLDGIGFQLTFFRSRTIHPAANPSRFAPTQLLFAHAALMLPERGTPLHAEAMQRLGHPGTRAAEDDTDLRLGDWVMTRDPQDRYRIALASDRFDVELRIDPADQPPWLQGEQGFSRKGPEPEQASHYYSRPQLRVDGRIQVAPDAARARTGGRSAWSSREVQGVAWFDHEWSSTLLDPAASGWDWCGLNLDDGSALVAFRIRHRVTGQPLWTYAAQRAPSESVGQILPEPHFEPLTQWRSPRTGTTWPVAMRLTVGGRTLTLDPLIADQELDSRASTGNVYWEGAVTVLEAGRRVGVGYLELTGYHGSLRL